jgi:hypothetical protein
MRGRTEPVCGAPVRPSAPFERMTRSLRYRNVRNCAALPCAHASFASAPECGARRTMWARDGAGPGRVQREPRRREFSTRSDVPVSRTVERRIAEPCSVLSVREACEPIRGIARTHPDAGFGRASDVHGAPVRRRLRAFGLPGLRVPRATSDRNQCLTRAVPELFSNP